MTTHDCTWKAKLVDCATCGANFAHHVFVCTRDDCDKVIDCIDDPDQYEQIFWSMALYKRKGPDGWEAPGEQEDREEDDRAAETEGQAGEGHGTQEAPADADRERVSA